jgi:Ca-activated chloride channel family protein
MKPTRVALLTALGMLLTSVSVYSLTPPGGATIGGEALQGGGVVADTASSQPAPPTELARFSAGSTLMVEGRVGHPKIARSSRGETFVMLEVRGTDAAKARTAAPINLALVIDRSGSMKGSRIRNAISAATAAVDRMSDGDVVSVVTFDTQVQDVVTPTTIGPGARERVNAAIRGIGLGGDTCISCGVEEGLRLLAQTSGKVNRVILLSDGDANHGVRDVPGFRKLAQRAETKGVSVTTIGVDVDYNEKIMTAIAQDSNGRHYFVENDSGLSRVFEQEAESLTSTVASNAEVTLDLGPGVELERVFDRSFRRSGNQVVVPLGTFARSEVKSVLLKVRVPSGGLGAAPVANVEMTYRDLVSENDGRCSGKLALEVVPSASEASDLDAVVNGRVQRSETAAVLKDANTLFEQGKVAEARRKLGTQEQSLRAAATKAKLAAPASRAADVDKDFERQLAAVGGADQHFNQAPQAAPAQPFATPPPGVAAAPPAPPPQQTRAGKSAVKENAATATSLGF